MLILSFLLGLTTGINSALLIVAISRWLVDLKYSILQISCFLLWRYTYDLRFFMAKFFDIYRIQWRNSEYAHRKNWIIFFLLCCCICIYCILIEFVYKNLNILGVVFSIYAFFAGVLDTNILMYSLTNLASYKKYYTLGFRYAFLIIPNIPLLTSITWYNLYYICIVVLSILLIFFYYYLPVDQHITIPKIDQLNKFAIVYCGDSTKNDKDAWKNIVRLYKTSIYDNFDQLSKLLPLLLLVNLQSRLITGSIIYKYLAPSFSYKSAWFIIDLLVLLLGLWIPKNITLNYVIIAQFSSAFILSLSAFFTGINSYVVYYIYRICCLITCMYAFNWKTSPITNKYDSLQILFLMSFEKVICGMIGNILGAIIAQYIGIAYAFLLSFIPVILLCFYNLNFASKNTILRKEVTHD